MASTGKKVTELSAITQAANTDLLYVVHDPAGAPTSKKITVGNLFNSFDTASVATAYTNAVAYTNIAVNTAYSNTINYFSNVSKDVLPATDSTYSLGNSSFQWKSLYLSSNALYLGGVPITTSGGALSVNNNVVVVAGAVTSANLTMATGKMLGRSSASTGTIEEIAVGAGLSLSGGTLSSTVVALPGGANTQVQFNDTGAFGGDAGFTFNKTTKSITLGGATITADSPIPNLVQTWNNSGVTFTGLKANITDTASNAASLLMDLQVGGSSKFKVDKTGLATLAGDISVNGIRLQSFSGVTLGIGTGTGSKIQLGSGMSLGWSSGNVGGSEDLILSRKAAANLRLGAADAAAPVAQTLSVQSVVAGTTNTAGANLVITGSQGTGTGAGGSIVFQVAPAGSSGTAQNALADALTITSGKIVTAASGLAVGDTAGNGLLISSSSIFLLGVGSLNWRSGGVGTGADLTLARDAANTLALRNGANAQTFNVYNTYTDASNYERGVVAWISNDLKIGVESAGTGVSTRQTHLYGGGQIRLYTANTLRWYVDASGHLLAGTDNTYDIGASGATRPRNIYAGTAIVGPLRATGTAPASATATGTAGDIRYDSNYIYVCTATNTWVRAALSTW